MGLKLPQNDKCGGVMINQSACEKFIFVTTKTGKKSTLFHLDHWQCSQYPELIRPVSLHVVFHNIKFELENIGFTNPTRGNIYFCCWNIFVILYSITANFV